MRLIEQLRWWADECDRTNFGCQARKLLLEAAEALEKAEPVKHGKWETVIDNDEFWGEIDYYKCSRCGKMELRDKQTPYCPNCGAKMDGGDNDA